MNRRFVGRFALVTGGTRGIGRAVAEQLLAEGCSVCITGRKPQSGWWDSVALCSYMAVDFGEQKSLERFCETISGMDFSLLVNNVGVFLSSLGGSVSEEAWARIMCVNVSAGAKIMSSLAERLASNPLSRVVNMSSIAAFVSRPGLAAYSASKAAVLGLTRSQALELAPRGVLVNAVCPAYTDTDMLRSLNEDMRAELMQNVPLGRFSQPSEVSEVVCFLISPQNTFITGQSIIIDGGVTIR